MNNFLFNKVLIPAISIIAVLSIVLWSYHNPSKDLTESIPGMDSHKNDSLAVKQVIEIGKNFESFEKHKSELQGNWPRFRGADFDNINKENIPIVNEWPEEGPKKLWELELGEGHAAPAIYKGEFYIIDYDEEKKADALRCFSLETGNELWRRWYKVSIKRNHGMSRTIPAVNEDYVLSIGPKCHVMCVSRDNGKFLWGIDLEKEYGLEIPFWYTGQCPLIDNNVAVIAPGGTSLLIGVNCKNGKVLWETPNENNVKMSHSSVMLATIHGKRMYLYAGIGGIFGISAEKEDMGEILWQTSVFPASVIAPSPVVLNNGKVFMTAGYGAGSILMQVNKDGKNFSVEILKELAPSEGIASEQQSPIFHNEHLFCVLPKDAGALRNQFVCFNIDDISKNIWASGKTNRFGLGPYLLADNKIIILNDDGTLSMIEASTTGFKQLAKYRVIHGHDAWGPLALADGRLLLRDSKTLVCLDIKEE